MKTCTYALVCALTAACAGGEAPARAPAPIVEGEWTLATIDTFDQAPARSVVSARLMLERDHTWRLRYDYHLMGSPHSHLWSSGLAGTWEARDGEPMAVRFEVSDDRSTSVGTLPSAGRLDVPLAGHRMRFVRTPE